MWLDAIKITGFYAPALRAYFGSLRYSNTAAEYADELI